MRETIEIFRAGTHMAENGRSYTFTEADVAGMASSYEPSIFRSPLVVGHPQTNDPAWGWAKSLSVSDTGVLVATHEDVIPAFAEAVDAKQYGKISAAFYAPEDAGNPKPGSWYLRHIGFLGAKAPAVKGLQAAFAEGQADFVAFSDVDMRTGWALGDVARAFRSLRDWFIGKYGVEEADKVIPAWTDQSLTSSAAAIATGDAAAAFAEHPSSSEPEAAAALASIAAAAEGVAALAAREAAIAAREGQVRANEARFAEAARKDARTEDAAFIDGLVAAGKLPIARRGGLLAIFAQADGDATVAFAEPNSTLRAELKTLLQDLGVAIHFAEFSAHDGSDGTPDATAVATRISAEVEAARGRGETISYSQAAGRLGLR